MTKNIHKQEYDQSRNVHCWLNMTYRWLSTAAEVRNELEPYWSFRNDTAVLDMIAMKGRRIIMSSSLQQRALNQLHINHMGIEKTGLFACLSIYWTYINNDTEKKILKLPCMLWFSSNTTKGKTILHNITGKPWKTVGPDSSSINNKHYLCIVVYHSKFPVIRQKGDGDDNLIKHVWLFLHNTGFQAD